jgi:hypothetical protein
MRGEPVRVRGHDKSVTIAFNLDHPAHLDEVTEVEEDADDDDAEENNAQPATKAVLEAIKSKTFVVGSKAVFADKRWVKVADVFSKTDTQILKTIGINSDHKDWDRYSERLAAVRAIQSYEFVMHVLERSRVYDEVAEIFVRVNSRGTKLRSSDLALAQITAKWQGVLDVLEDYLDHCESLISNLRLAFRSGPWWYSLLGRAASRVWPASARPDSRRRGRRRKKDLTLLSTFSATTGT